MSEEPTEDNILSYPQKGEETAKNQYDVFLCYDRESNEDKRSVRKVGNQLKQKGIVPWFDEWEVRPGTPWLVAVEKQIENIKAAAVFVGQRGVDRWLKMTINALLCEFVDKGCPVIPVLLPEVPNEPKLPVFLRIIDPVDFRIFKQNPSFTPDEDPFNRLIFGITGQPVWEKQDTSEMRIRIHTPTYKLETKIRSYVLIALLESSPVVISAMYDLLTKKAGLTIDKVVVLHSEREDVVRGYELVKEALANKCNLQRVILPFEDTNSWTNACLVLREILTLLDTCQARGDSAYLSLTGGSESITALIASVAPSFSCVKHLYHVIDPDEERFFSIDELKPADELELAMSPLHRQLAMHPDLDPLILVDIPFESGQQIDQEFVSRLRSAGKVELAKMEYLEKLPLVPLNTTIDSVLIVPLGRFPMVATQLYILLQHQEHRNIHQVVLVYPAQDTEIACQADLIRRALREKANIQCTYVRVPDLKEIDSLEACRRYQAALESVIDQVRRVYPDCKVDLALSGGYEGMTAMTIFAAQKKQLPYVYHRLITDDQLGKAIDQQMTVKALTNPSLSREDRNDRLFLRAYEDEGVYTKCVLFKVPVFSI